MSCSKGVLQLINQIISTIELLPEDVYEQSLEIFNGTSLGKHFRHVYNFFNCLVDQQASNELDYACRSRSKLIEEDKYCALKSFEALQSLLAEIDESTPIIVNADFEISDGVRPNAASTLGREMMYAYDHAIHHLAIIKIGIASLDIDVPIDENLGIASSTLKHKYAITHGD